MTKRFEGKVSVVTGAGRGIGRSIARRLAAEGSAVAVLDIARTDADATAATITAEGGSALALQVDAARYFEIPTAVPGAKLTRRVSTIRFASAAPSTIS